MYRFDPKDDITALEVALITPLLIEMRMHPCLESIPRKVNQLPSELRRHFSPPPTKKDHDM